MKGRGRFANNANSAFFQQNKTEGEEEVTVVSARGKKGGDVVDVMAGFDGSTGGKISEKGLLNAYKRAKQSGSFIVTNQEMEQFPKELSDFVNFKPDDDENWWDGQQLTRIDVSLNLIPSIPAEFCNQSHSEHLGFINIQGNKLTSLPSQVYTLKNLKFLDCSNNAIKEICQGQEADMGSAASLQELRLANNQIEVLPEAIGQITALVVLDLKKNKLKALPNSFSKLSGLCNLNLDDNQFSVIPASFKNLVNLNELSVASNKLQLVEDDAFATMTKLSVLDLHQNQMKGVFNSVPESQKLDQLLLSFNHIDTLENLQRCKNLTVLDLHNNQFSKLSDHICELYHLKTLKISNNNLSDINPKVSLIDSLVRMSIEGNPLRSIKPAMRGAGAVELKKFLKMRLGDEEVFKEEKKQAVALHIPGATQKEDDQWDILLREFVVNNAQFDCRNKDIKELSPKIWTMYPKLKVLDLSQNPGLVDIPEEIGQLTNLQTLRFQQCSVTKLPLSILREMDELQTLDLDRCKLTDFYPEYDTFTPQQIAQINLKSLNHLNINGNQITKIPGICKHFPNLKQLMMHMNKVDDVKELCRSAYKGLETVDLGGNKVTEIPVAMIHFLKGLCQLTLMNNDIQKLPNLIGMHKTLKNIQVDGNPLKSIRRPIIARGSAGIIQYLGDRYIEGTDDKVEEWALEQDKKDLAQNEEYEKIRQELATAATQVVQEEVKVVEEETKQVEAPVVQQVEEEKQVSQPEAAQVVEEQKQPVVSEQEVIQPKPEVPVDPKVEPAAQIELPHWGVGAQRQPAEEQKVEQKEEVKVEQTAAPTVNKNHPSSASIFDQPDPQTPMSITGKKLKPNASDQNGPRMFEDVSDAPAKSTNPEEIEKIKSEIAEIDGKIKVLQNEVDNNFNLTSIKIRGMKREINQLQSQKNKLAKQI